MKEDKKPQWLKDVEKELKKFNDSKTGQMSDTQIARSNNAVNNFKLEDSETQRKRSLKAQEKHPDMQSRGGKTRATQFTSEYQSMASKSVSSESRSKAGKIGASVTGAQKKANTKILKQKLYDLIELKEFTVYDLEHLLENFDEFQDLQMFRFYLRDKKMYEVVGTKPNGKPGPAPKLYSKIKS